jgi:6-phosphofructokinase 1
MGRNAGWLTAASLLAAGEDNTGPDMILLPEVPLCEDSFIKAAAEKLKDKNTLVVTVSEGVKCLDGEYLSSKGASSVTRDAFGHVQLSGAGHNLKEMIKSRLGIKRIRSVEFSAVQRCAAHISSRTDVEEAFMAGHYGAQCAANGGTAKMVTFNRLADKPYAMGLGTAPVSEIANAEKVVPAEWIDAKNYFVTNDFITYALPLIQGELPPFMINGVPRHLVLKK